MQCTVIKDAGATENPSLTDNYCSRGVSSNDAVLFRAEASLRHLDAFDSLLTYGSQLR
ncbi:hypothetical protein Poly21_16710 [Allorhodopirellula heiligendammensis]|uniref:Uncharacterized protein n=1 Tax=Allorhodopirellula heiligendammensis TaxID=2714739 RepID=A0A5C6C5R6_9BACT|nr:hypothetical protein Poly21_16710 [Allorhodopirellula heiligendammensis]